MKKKNKIFPSFLRASVLFLFVILIFIPDKLLSQDSTATEPVEKPKPRPVTIFDGQFIVDNPTATMSRKKVLMLAIQHRFGTVNNGRQDLYGIFGPANIRLGMNYNPIDNLSLGVGVTKNFFLVDFNVKYAIIKQMDSGGWPVSITYFGNIAIDSRPKQGNFINDGDRISYFNQIMFARMVTEKLSVQVAPSLSYFNNIAGYVDKNGDIQPSMRNYDFAISFMGRYKLTERFHLIASYDQSLTQHPMNNPHPNICLGFETTTVSHAFQVFVGNSNSIIPQYGNFYNQNDFTKGQFLVGFNITRRWNFNN